MTSRSRGGRSNYLYPDDVDAAYDSSTNDNDKDNDSQDRQDRDGKIPGKGRKAPNFEDESAEDQHVYCFVPGDGIDVVVLAQYLKRLVDGAATIRVARHPTDPSRVGYTIGASSTIGRETLEVLLADTMAWQKEQSTRDFRRSPYDYSESDTFANRKREGPAKSKPAALSRPRNQQESKARTAAESRGGGATQRHGGRTAETGTYGGRHTAEPVAYARPDPDAFQLLSLQGSGRHAAPQAAVQVLPYANNRVQAEADIPPAYTRDAATYGGRHAPTARVQAVRR